MNELEGAQAIIDAARDYCDAKPSAMGRIVNAVNTYDKRESLIRELVAALECIKNHQRLVAGSMCDDSVTYRMAVAALAKARDVIGPACDHS